MVPVHHTGFRWGAQLDPFWNAYFLGCVLSISQKIEEVRVPENVVYSYSINKDTYLQGKIFKEDAGWYNFIKESVKKADEFNFVVICDIADCYSRISHHKLENNLKIIDTPHATQNSILTYIGFLTEKRSSGLPVGGPSSRILSELSLNNVDQYLLGRGINFLRFADDYHIFANTKTEAFEYLFRISEFLDNEGLSLQKAKTRIVSSHEYKQISDSIIGQENEEKTPIQKLMSLNLRYDPYAPDAEEKYEELKGKLKEIDIVGLLNDQLSQTKIHIATTRRIVSALTSIDRSAYYGAILSILDNMDNLFPISANIFISIMSMFEELRDQEKDEVCDRLIQLYDSGHEVCGIESFVSYIVRIVGKRKSIKNQQFLVRCFENAKTPLIRRDIILVFSNWENMPWLSLYRRHFETAGSWERRAFIIASYSMSDEGRHWRQNAKKRFDEFEQIVVEWRSKRVQQQSVIAL